ncbi:MAG: hypothetical protein ACRCZS_20090 [Chroococcidiopsis sp.]
MTQTQVQQVPQYTEQYRQFDSLVVQLHPNYGAIAYSLASTEGLKTAIDFCLSKVGAVEVMQACRDFDR